MVDFLVAVLRPDGLMPKSEMPTTGGCTSSGGTAGGNRRTPASVRPGRLHVPARRMAATGERGANGRAAWWGLDAGLSTDCRRRLPALRHFPVPAHRDPASRATIFVTNGSVGTSGFGNHKHNDLLGFEYHVRGRAADRRSRQLRIYLRSRRSEPVPKYGVAHTVTVDGQEQNDLRPEWLFRMFEKARPSISSVRDHGDALEYRGRHNGYARLPDPLSTSGRSGWCDRTVRSTIIDMLDGRGTHSISGIFISRRALR